MADKIVAQPTIHFPVVGYGGELYAGLGTWEEGGCQANIDFLVETGGVDATQQKRIKWAGCSISPTHLEAHIHQSHPPKAGDEGR